MRKQYEGQGVGFLAISLERDLSAVERGASIYGVTMPVAVAEGETLAPLGVSRVPSTVFIDSDGMIVASASGPRDRAFFEKRVRALTEK